MSVTLEQIRGAMAILDITQAGLSEKTGISPRTITNLLKEDTHWTTKESTKHKVIDCLENEGIEFIEGGVRRATFLARAFEGKPGFARFRRDVLREIHKGDANVCIFNLDEREFDKWGYGKINQDYRNEMAQIRKNDPDLRFRSLVKKGDMHFSAARHSEYRWVSEENFSDIPFYIYGHNVATLIFEDDNIFIMVQSHPKLEKYYRSLFEQMWDKAERLNFDPMEYLPKGINGEE